MLCFMIYIPIQENLQLLQEKQTKPNPNHHFTALISSLLFSFPFTIIAQNLSSTTQSLSSQLAKKRSKKEDICITKSLPGSCIDLRARMARIRIEVCMISARGLPRSSSLWKLHWFAVGWIDPLKNKYCSKIDSSGGPTPMWRTKFSVVVDEEKVDLGRLILKMEVRSREAIFLREKLHGVASIPLRGFMERLDGEERRWSSPSSSSEEKVIRSLQLRGRKSGEPRGFVDVSVGIWEEERAGNDASLLTDDYTNSSLPRNRGRQKTSLSMEDGTPITYSDLPSQRQHGETSQSRPSTPPPQQQQQQPFIRRRARKTSASSSATTDVYRQANPTTPYRPFDVGRRNEQEPDEDFYTRRPTPPPPPPPSNTGFLPSFFPSTYTTGGVPPPNLAGFGAGVGAGAFAAGAVLFGDDFMSTSGFPN